MLLVFPAREGPDYDSPPSFEFGAPHHPCPRRGRSFRPGGRRCYAGRALAPTNQFPATPSTTLPYSRQTISAPGGGTPREEAFEKTACAARIQSSSRGLL